MGIWHNLEQQIWMSDLFSGLIFSFLRRETWRKGLTWNTFFRFRGVKAKYVTVHPCTLSGQTRRTTVRIYPSHVCASHPSTTRARERSSFLLPPYLCPTLARVRGPSPPSDPEPMAAEPPADGRDPRRTMAPPATARWSPRRRRRSWARRRSSWRSCTRGRSTSSTPSRPKRSRPFAPLPKFFSIASVWFFPFALSVAPVSGVDFARGGAGDWRGWAAGAELD